MDQKDADSLFGELEASGMRGEQVRQQQSSEQIAAGEDGNSRHRQDVIRGQRGKRSTEPLKNHIRNLVERGENRFGVHEKRPEKPLLSHIEAQRLLGHRPQEHQHHPEAQQHDR